MFLASRVFLAPSAYVGSMVGRITAVSPALLLPVPLEVGILYICSDSPISCMIGLGSVRTYPPLVHTRTTVRNTLSLRPWRSGGPSLR